jgi:hypothetical protein
VDEISAAFSSRCSSSKETTAVWSFFASRPHESHENFDALMGPTILQSQQILFGFSLSPSGLLFTSSAQTCVGKYSALIFFAAKFTINCTFIVKNWLKIGFCFLFFIVFVTLSKYISMKEV